MRWNGLFCALCAALTLASGAPAEEKVKLEYKFQPGMELTLKTSGAIKIAAGAGGESVSDFSGVVRCTVAEADAAGALVGQTSSVKIMTAVLTPQGERQSEQTDDRASVCRIDSAGHTIALQVKGDEKASLMGRRMLRQINYRQFDSPPLPADAVAVGDSWETVVDSGVPVLAMPMSVKVLSTLAEIKTVDGHRCAVIRSKLSPGREQIAPDAPWVSVKGEAQTIFDIEGGFCRSAECKLDVQAGFKDRGVEAMLTTDSSSTLDSVRMLPAEEAAREAKTIKMLDAAVARICEGDFDKATETLGSLKFDELPDEWKPGIARVRDQVKAFSRSGREAAVPRMIPPRPPLSPARQLYAEAQRAVRQLKWADAVAKFKEVADKFPDDAAAADALSNAAAICEAKLNDAHAAEELRKRAAALKEKR